MARKIVPIVIGAILVLCGLGATAPGILLVATTGSDSTLESGSHPISTATPALVSQTRLVSDVGGPGGKVGATTITVTARSAGQPIFLAVARASDVEGYLSDVAYDEVRDFALRPYSVQTARHEGRVLARPPGRETFWLASVTGTTATLDWQAADGDTRLLMMNADGSPGVAADVQFGIKVNGLFGIGLGAVIAGVLAIAAGVVLIVVGIRTRPPPRAPAEQPSAGG
jgi:hypothetical protein